MKVILDPGDVLDITTGSTHSEARVEVVAIRGRIVVTVNNRTVFDEETDQDFGVTDGADNPADAPVKHLDGPAVPEKTSEPRAMGALADGQRDMTDLAPQQVYRGDRELYQTKP